MKPSYFHNHLHMDAACTTVSTHRDRLRKIKTKRRLVSWCGPQHLPSEQGLLCNICQVTRRFHYYQLERFFRAGKSGNISRLSHFKKWFLFHPCHTRYTVSVAANGLIAFLLARTQGSAPSFWVK